MRLFLLLPAVFIVAVGGAAPAHAQNYPWCAYYGGMGGGGKNCGFTTFQQCQATVSGIGGFCDRNPLYEPPPGPHAHRRYPD